MGANARVFHRRCCELPACGSKNPMSCSSHWGARQFSVCQLVAAVANDSGPIQFLPAELARGGLQRTRRKQWRLGWRRWMEAWAEEGVKATLGTDVEGV